MDAHSRQNAKGADARHQTTKELASSLGGALNTAPVLREFLKELRHSPEKVWQAQTDPAHVREWAPFETDGSLGTVGTTVNLTWVGTPQALETKVTRADAPKVLEYNDTRWELEALNGGTRLTLWHNIDHRFISWGAAGWHIAFDVLDRLLAGQPIGRTVGGEAMKSEGWQRLNAEYAKQFGVETPKWPPRAAP